MDKPDEHEHDKAVARMTPLGPGELYPLPEYDVRLGDFWKADGVWYQLREDGIYKDGG